MGRKRTKINTWTKVLENMHVNQTGDPEKIHITWTEILEDNRHGQAQRSTLKEKKAHKDTGVTTNTDLEPNAQYTDISCFYAVLLYFCRTSVPLSQPVSHYV